jgi:N12 class adenine-specific DNA methylase
MHGYLDVKGTVTYNETTDKFVVKFNDTYGNDKYRTLKINDKSFDDWFQKYIYGENLNVYVEGKKDTAASTKATQAMRKVDEYFMNYLKANPEVSKPVMDRYNRIANNWVDKDYKKDTLVIPGANPNFKFRGNQLEFVNMAITLGSAVNAQRTGAGKTATNAAVNQMLKVTGRANKPMAIVPGKVIKKFVRDIKEGSRGLASIFPDMKILDVTEYNFNEAMARIAFNNWDLVLIPDTWFKNIEVTPERESQYVQKMIDDLISSEAERAVEQGSKRSKNEFENRLQKLRAKLAELRNYARKDGIYFEDLGVDAISLDEAQSVKNLVTSVKGQDLGMSATPSKQL